MTSTPVMGGSGVQILDAIAPIANTSKSDSLDFKSFMDNAGNRQKEVVKSSQTSNDKDQLKENFRSDNVNDKIKEANANVQKENTASDEVTPEDVKKVTKAIAEVVDKIKEELDVSEEDIINALSLMGLNPTALLAADDVTNFVVEVTKTEDPILLATDENLMNAIESIEDTVNRVISDICQELNMEPEEFVNALGEFKNFEPVEPDLLQNNFLIEDQNQETPVDITNKVAKVENTQAVEIGVSNTETKVDTTQDRREVTTSDKAVSFDSKVEALETKVEVEMTTTKEDAGSKDNHQASSDFLSFAQNLVKETVAALNEANTETVFSTVDAIDIINQITDSIKTQVSTEVTEISLKLHPETLGNVSVKISADNEGVLTARFIADNEAVKSVIEAQAVSLKETLEAKGVTIEAVEVMVGSHEFDENLNRERNNNSSERSSSSRRIRRINIGDADDSIDEIDDEAKLAKEIMEQNGNTVDYTA